MNLTTSLYKMSTMPRCARKLGNSGIYHVMMRGNNRQDIFDDEDDFLKMAAILKKCITADKSLLHAYCLMSNHVHLLIQVGSSEFHDTESLGHVMKQVAVSYAKYYNKKTKRIGTLFQERYKSENVDSNTYFLSVLRYIHRNPVKARIVSSPASYKWSSYHAYMSADASDFVYTELGCKLLGNDFPIFMNKEEKELCIDIDEFAPSIPDIELSSIISDTFGFPASYIPILPKEERDKTIKKIAEIKGVNFQQLSRVTKVPVSTIYRIF